MIQLRPGEQFPITYRISDPSDSTTYYVQAKIYNSRTNTLLDTVNLADQGNGVFRQNWQVVGDSSDQGLFIDINVNVYTDSGYTAVSSNYQQENRQYLVQERVNTHRFGGGGGGVDIDYKKIKKIVDEAITNIATPRDYSEKLTEIYNCVEDIKAGKIVNISKLSNDISSLSESLKGEIKGSAESFDGLREQVLVGFENLTNTISEIPTTETIENKIDSLKGDLAEAPSIPKIIESIPSKVDEIKQGLSAMAKALSQVETMTIHKGLSIPEIPQEKPQEVSKEKPKEQKDFSVIAKLLSQ